MRNIVDLEALLQEKSPVQPLFGCIACIRTS